MGRVIKGEISDPPPGEFDALSPFIKWIELSDKSLKSRAELIRKCRIPDYVAGENKRGVTKHWYRDRDAKLEARYNISVSLLVRQLEN